MKLKKKYNISKTLFIIIFIIMFWRFGELIFNWNYKNAFWLCVSSIVFIFNWVNFVIIVDRYDQRK